jgi:glycosyltransferase involved in cell wall biosynthesis
MTRGGIITPAKADLMSEAILSLAAQNQLRESYSSNARAGFDAHFSVDRMAEAYMRLYERRK